MATKSKEERLAIANEILNLLGGTNRLHVMTGAYNFVVIDNGVSFRIKNASANFIKITLSGLDLYDLEVGRIRGMNYKVVAEEKGLYNDMLKPQIEKITGMTLTMPRVVGFNYKKGGKVEGERKYWIAVFEKGNMRKVVSSYGDTKEDATRQAMLSRNNYDVPSDYELVNIRPLKEDNELDAQRARHKIEHKDKFYEMVKKNPMKTVEEADGFKVGDKVTFTNDNGVVWKGHEILAIEDTDDEAKFYLDTDAYWFPHKSSQLHKEKSSYRTGGVMKGDEGVNSLLKRQMELDNKLTEIKLESDLMTQKGVDAYNKKIEPIKNKLREIEKELDSLGYEAYADGGVLSESDYRDKLEKLRDEGKISLSIGNHGLIFIQKIGGGNHFMQSCNSYKEAYKIYSGGDLGDTDGALMVNGGNISKGKKWKRVWTDTNDNKGYDILEIVNTKHRTTSHSGGWVVLSKIIESSESKRVGETSEEYKDEIKRIFNGKYPFAYKLATGGTISADGMTIEQWEGLGLNIVGGGVGYSAKVKGGFNKAGDVSTGEVIFEKKPLFFSKNWNPYGKFVYIDKNEEEYTSREVPSTLLGNKNKFSDGGSIASQNKQMVAVKGKEIKHHAEELMEAIEGNEEVPAWVVAKIERSATDISDAAHYLEGVEVLFAEGGSISEQNKQMVSVKAKEIQHHAEELMEALKRDNDVPAWVVAKIERSATDISDAAHYLEGMKGESFEDGGTIGFIPMDLEEKLAIQAKWGGMDIKGVIGYLNAMIDSHITDEDLIYKPTKNTTFQREIAKEKKVKEIWNEIEPKYKGELKGNHYYSLIKHMVERATSGHNDNILKEFKPYRHFKKDSLKSGGITFSKYTDVNKPMIGDKYKSGTTNGIVYEVSPNGNEFKLKDEYGNKSNSWYHINSTGKAKISRSKEAFSKGDAIKELQVGQVYILPNDEEIKIERFFIENTDEDWVEYTRSGKTYENNVKTLKQFLNNWGGKLKLAKGGTVDGEWVVYNPDTYEPISLHKSYRSAKMASDKLFNTGDYDGVGCMSKEEFEKTYKIYYPTKELVYPNKLNYRESNSEEGSSRFPIDMEQVEKSAQHATDEKKWTNPQTVKDFESDIIKYESLKNQLDNNEIKPYKIIGTGFKPQYARPLAYKWIYEQIAIAKRAIEILNEKSGKMARGGEISPRSIARGTKYMVGLSLPYRTDFYLKSDTKKTGIGSIMVAQEIDESKFGSEKKLDTWSVSERKYLKEEGGYYEPIKDGITKEEAFYLAKSIINK